MRFSQRSGPQPLSGQVFQILLSLADGPRHGYAIILDVRTRSRGEIQLTTSTLYDALSRMVDAGWIGSVDAPPAERDPRRRYYELTPAGRVTALQEAARLDRLLACAREKNLLPL